MTVGVRGATTTARLARRLVTGIAFALLGAGAAGFVLLYMQPPLVEVFSSPQLFSRRQGDFTANVCGITSRAMAHAGRTLRYRVNDGPWADLRQDHARTHSRHFRIEMRHDEMVAGHNLLLIEAAAVGLGPQLLSIPFEYDPSPPRLPDLVSWDDATLEVEDGAWQRLWQGSAWWVRPRPGQEGYDRLLIVKGAFAGGRRVSVDVVFRRALPARPYAFGIFPLWGGRPDEPGTDPRDGWSFALAWYWSRYEGYGAEFSYKYGHEPAVWTNAYRNIEVVPGRTYRLVSEARPEVDEAGRHLRWQQRTWLWPAGEPQPQSGPEVTDDGAPQPPGEYGVALIAYWTQVEFGPVLVEPLAPAVASQ